MKDLKKKLDDEFQEIKRDTGTSEVKGARVILTETEIQFFRS